MLARSTKICNKSIIIVFITGAGTQAGPRTLHILHNSEYPASSFALLEVPINAAASNAANANQSSPTPTVKTVSLVADNLFDLLVVKMAPMYTSKKIKIEAKGPRFELGDFVVKLGSVTMSQNFKGILIEVYILETACLRCTIINIFHVLMPVEMLKS